MFLTLGDEIFVLFAAILGGMLVILHQIGVELDSLSSPEVDDRSQLRFPTFELNF